MKKSIVMMMLLLAVVSTSVLTSGCASIMSGVSLPNRKHTNVKVTSEPTGAVVFVYNNRTGELIEKVTPCEVRLRNGWQSLDGNKTAGGHYSFIAAKNGFKENYAILSGKNNPKIWWNLLGPLVIGITVDNVTGAAWILEDRVHIKLEPEKNASVFSSGNNIQKFREKMQKISKMNWKPGY